MFYETPAYPPILFDSSILTEITSYCGGGDDVEYLFRLLEAQKKSRRAGMVDLTETGMQNEAIR